VARPPGGTRPLSVAYVYASRRGPDLAAELAHRAPDTGLLGLNHLAAHGIDARIHAPRYQRRPRSGQLGRVAALAEQATVPWLVGADVVFTPSLGVLVPSGRLAHRAGRAAVVVLNFNLSTRYAAASPARRRALKAQAGSATFVVSPSEAQTDFLVGEVGLDPSRVRTVEAGVDTDHFAPQPLATGGYSLAVGRDKGRDWATLLAAVAGTGRRTVLVTSAANLAGLDVPAEVEVMLDVSPKRLADLYRGAACVVVPTRAGDDAQGCDCSGQTVLLEAMACGRPVVVTARPSLRGYVEDGRTALVVEPRRPDDLSAAMGRVLDDPALAERLASAAHREARERFSTRAFAARLAPVLREAAGRGRRVRDTAAAGASR
jgi:glycosyltransferase involved in cell wall biosynthesis